MLLHKFEFECYTAIGMLVEKMKPRRDSHVFVGLDRKKSAKRSFNRAVAVLLAVLFTILFILSFYNTYRVQQLEGEVLLLRNRLEEVNYLQSLQNLDIYGDDANYVADPNYVPDYEAGEEYPMAKDGEEVDFDLIGEVGDLLTAGNFTKEGFESDRTKREVDVDKTVDGVLINTDTYAEAKRQNKTRGPALKLYEKIRPVGGDGVHTAIPKYQESYLSGTKGKPSPSSLKHYEELDGKHATSKPALSRRSRVMHVEDKSKAFMKIVKKPQLKSLELEGSEGNQDGSTEFTVVREESLGRRHKQRKNLEVLNERHFRRRPLTAIHFSGDTSRYVYGQDEFYNGNGHILHQHPERVFVDWTANDWVSNLGMDRHFDYDGGTLTVKEPGLYFIYAQIYYIDKHDISGYIVYKNDVPILQCTTMTTHSHEVVNKTNTCFTGGTEYFEQDDRITIRDVHSRYSVFQPGKSFFGAIKLGDLRMK